MAADWGRRGRVATELGRSEPVAAARSASGRGASGRGTEAGTVRWVTRPPMRRVVAIALVGVAVVSLGACGAPTPDRTDLVGALETSGVPAEVARCTADALVGSLSRAQLDQIVELGGAGVPSDDADQPNEAADKLRNELANCRQELPTTTLTPTVPVVPIAPSTGPAGSAGSAGTAGTAGPAGSAGDAGSQARLDPGPTTVP